MAPTAGRGLAAENTTTGQKMIGQEIDPSKNVLVVEEAASRQSAETRQIAITPKGTEWQGCLHPEGGVNSIRGLKLVCGDDSRVSTSQL